MEIQCLSPRVGYFARIDKKRNFLKSMPTSSAAVNVCFVGVIDLKPNLIGENKCFPEKKSSLGFYQPNL